MKRTGISLAETVVGMMLVTMILLIVATTMAVGLKANTRNSTVTQSYSNLSVVRESLQKVFNDYTDFSSLSTALPSSGSTTNIIELKNTIHGDKCTIKYKNTENSIEIIYDNTGNDVQFGRGYVKGWNLTRVDDGSNSNQMTVRQTITWADSSNGDQTYYEDLYFQNTVLTF